MAATADSKPAFQQRLEELELQELAPKFEKLGWQTFGDFGFACPAPPGQDNASFEKEVLQPLLGEDRKHAAKLRRLFAQSYAIAAADTERYLATDDKAAPLHPAEREDRRSKLAVRLTGFKLEGASDPSFALIDRCSAIITRGEVRYIPWEKCTARSAELQEITEERMLKPDRDGLIHLTARTPEQACDISSDMLMGLALRRRALAADVAGLASYDSFNTWHEAMIAEFLREPMPGYAKVSLVQLRRADTEVFRLAGEFCRNGTKRKAGETQT